jgi:hypothetical protein
MYGRNVDVTNSLKMKYYNYSNSTINTEQLLKLAKPLIKIKFASYLLQIADKFLISEGE